MKRFYVEFGLNLRRSRQRPEIQLSQEALAKRVGISRTSVTNIEKGRQQLPMHMLYLFADALGVEPAALLPDKKRLSADDRVPTVNAKDLTDDVVGFLDRIAPREKV